MPVYAGQNWTYWLVPVNLSRIPGQKSAPQSIQVPWVNLVWQPYQVQAPSTDAVWPDEWTFDLSQTYDPDASGGTTASLTIPGKQPVNTVLAVAPPIVDEQSITQSSTGGHIPGGVTLYICVAGLNGSNQPTPLSQFVAIAIAPGTDTNWVSFNVAWPAATLAYLAQYAIFACTSPDLMCAVQTAAIGGLYESYSLTGVLPRSTWSPPDTNNKGVRIKIKELLHGGVLGVRVDNVNSAGHVVTCEEAIDEEGTDNWAGRKIIGIGRYNGSGPFVSFDCTAFDPATGAFTLEQDPSALEVGDAIVVALTQDGGSNSGNPLVLTDSGLRNAESDHEGLDPTEEQGMQVRVIAGFNRGQTRKVVSATNTSWTLDNGLLVDATSIWIVEGASWLDSTDSVQTNARYDTVAQLTLPTSNYLDGSLLVMGFTVDIDGIESGEADAPLRMVYVYGDAYAQAFVTDSVYSVKTTDHVLTFQGTNQAVYLPPSASIRRYPRYLIHDGAGTLTVYPAANDTVQNKTSVTMQPGDRIVLMPSS
jgi:hypothetical protein